MKIFEATSQTITRPSDTTAYASGDLIANSTTAGSVTPFALFIPYGRGVFLYRAAVIRSATAVTNATFRLHLYKDSPTVANGDNGAWSSTASNYLGPIDIAGSTQAFSDTASAFGVYVNNSVFAPMTFVTDTDQLVYGLLEARAAYTPSSAETISIKLVGQAYIL